VTDDADRVYDRLLVLRSQAGDQVAFTEIVDRYQPRLRYYLRKMLVDVHAAEDVMQDVWCDVFRAMPRLADAGAFRAWLYRIARDRAFRDLRKRRPRPRPVDELALAAHAAEIDKLKPEDVELVHAALDKLAPEHREALILRFIDDMSYTEMAAIVGCQVGTVRSRLHYAKQALGEVLERMAIHD
jgi:RNA polymerase sigma-70 factor, ECF subfamily